MKKLPLAPHAPLGPSLDDAQAAGFPMGGEPLALDLADTLVTVATPFVDLLADRATSDRFWHLHARLLPRGWSAPTLGRTRRLRDAVRGALDAALHGRAPQVDALATINAAAALASPRLAVIAREGAYSRVERWHARDAGDLALAAAARSAIEILTDPSIRAHLRRCASPACSMLFVTGDARRKWCTPNICGNRDRVARHYRRHVAEAPT